VRQAAHDAAAASQRDCDRSPSSPQNSVSSFVSPHFWLLRFLWRCFKTDHDFVTRQGLVNILRPRREIIN